MTPHPEKRLRVMKFACLWLCGAILGYALGGTIEAALIAGTIAFYTARARPTIAASSSIKEANYD